MKHGTTTRSSVAELEREAGQGSQTDLARLRRMTEVELDGKIASDPDWAEVPRDWHLKAEAVMPSAKRLLSLRLDADVVDWFKSQGSGYQTRMNAVLRSFMQHAAKRGE
jgi:uncharacterized protein (DUF4415 family)